MATSMYKTPGVYVKELPAFAPSIVGVQTAVPAFIGYTAKAEISGKPVYNQAIPIGSLADYIEVFGEDFPPKYEIKEATADEVKAGTFDFKVFDPTTKTEKFYVLTQTTSSEFYLYNSVRLFYANGGGEAFVVSVGDYAAGTVISKDALIKGLEVTKEQNGPTMLVIPDAVLLPSSGADPWVSTDFQEVARAMLLQCSELQDRVAILDVYGTQHAKKDNWEAIITQFRQDVGDFALNYGMAYFPFLETSVVAASEFTYENMSPSIALLQQILGWERENLYGPLNPDKPTRADAVQDDIDKMDDEDVDVAKLNQNLTAALPLLVDMEQVLAAKNNMLPPSGGMAGVYTFTDGTKGVWNAPANIALSSVVQPTFRIDSQQQEDLNVPVDGKAVDAIRDFAGRGPVVWGARTLDGNSNDYRYIQVRRTLIYIEQSIKTALNQFVFAANDGNTWSTVVAMVSSFLQGVWSQGGLMGAKASDAFTVQCGLGSTMTGQDILNGYMIVQVTLQMIRPAEFIELTFKQKMEGVS